MDHAKELSIFWDSKSHKPKVIYTKSDNAPDPFIQPHPTVTGSCRKLKLRFDILATP
jgi:hypothetical protein